jgi:EAL domain-containing protein (putative c-di-GMP-specific phosphodiesterase class I)/PAS domain-containing protein
MPGSLHTGSQHRLFAKQLARATDAAGAADVARLGTLVGAADAEAERDRRRTERAMGLMAEELAAANARLEALVQALSTQNRRFEAALDNMPMGLAMYDARGQLVVANARLNAVLSLPPGALRVGMSYGQVVATCTAAGHFPEASAAEVYAARRRIFAPGGDYTFEERRGDRIVAVAGRALYRAKADCRGTWRFFEPEMDARMQARRQLELDLRRALAAGEFHLLYQPLINLVSGRIAGFEALLRWRHPGRGLVSPADFIPLAEETGLILPLGEWVVREACREAVGWPPEVSVAVNVSAVQFGSPRLVDAVAEALAASGLPGERLEIEVTESIMLQDTAATMAVLRRLRAFGIRISMDDFGTGYSSLSYLRSFPFDKIKIDQSFVRDLEKRGDARAIVRAISGLGGSLGMRTSAEGVETPEQFEQLRADGCTEGQGYLFGRPVPGAAARALLRARPGVVEASAA